MRRSPMFTKSYSASVEVYTVILLVIFLYNVAVLAASDGEDMKNSTAAESEFAEMVERHKAQRATIRRIVSNGKCKHLYFDFGTNIGIQIRKIYEPQYYPGSAVLKYYDKYFVGASTPESTHGLVCSVGFEPNTIHRDGLLELQDAYQKAGFPAVIFTETAVTNYNGKINFYRDVKASTADHEWGSSVHEREDKVVVTSIAMDIDEFVHDIMHVWRRSDGYDKDTSKVLSKMDIEGAEFTVLTHMMIHGSLCFIDFMMLEWHLDYLPKGTTYEDFSKMISLGFQGAERCHYHLDTEDDESYHNDHSPLPAPNTAGRNVTRRSLLLKI